MPRATPQAAGSDRLLLARAAKLLFVGDSITDAGRSESGEATPWNLARGYGQGYVAYFQALFEATRPGHSIRVVNRGVSGNTIVDLRARWPRDVLAPKPDWLSVMIGINDVWRQFDCPLQTELHVLLPDFKAIYAELLALVRPRLDGLILATPFILEKDRADPLRKTMDAYGAAVRALAVQFDAVLVDTQLICDELMASLHPTSLAWDRIHLNATGHMALARGFLQAVGYEWH
jgi:lysophospholipase L1-like esterase